MVTRGKTHDRPMMARPKDALNDFFICDQTLLQYVGLFNIEQGFLGEQAPYKFEKNPKFTFNPL